MAKRIIVVEDEAIIAAEIEAILTKLGYQVVGKARNGDKALDLFKTANPDLALLDISIKGSLNGIDLAKIIKKSYAFPHVFLTSHSDVQTLDEVKATLPYGYIVKPFTENDLRSTLALAFYKFEDDNKDIFPSQEALLNKYNINLTNREYGIYHLLFAGKTYSEIALETGISINTVKTFIKKIFQKLNVNSRSEAVNWVLKK